jgi:hypothetical protein
MDNYDKLKIVMNFIHAYNDLDIDRMLRDIHEDVQFENVTNGKTDLSIRGIDAFEKQAKTDAGFFKTRDEKILKICFIGDIVELTVDFYGILARDMSEELKAGNALQVVGKSIFSFQDDKIISIKDSRD